MKQLCLLLVVCLACCSAGYGQKAYDPVYYTGKAGAYTINLTLGNGYPGANELTRKDTLSEKKEVFTPDSGVPDERGTMQLFQLDREAGASIKGEYYLLYGMEELYDTPPATIKITWHNITGNTTFTVRQKKK